MSDNISTQVEQAVAAVANRGEARNVYLAACGGSLAMLQPGENVLDRESADVAVHHLTAAEFVRRNPKALGEHSVVIAASHSGTTPETVEAAAFGRKNGALTIAITNDAESPLAQNADQVVTYVHGPDIALQDSSTGVLLRVLFGMLGKLEGNPKAAHIESSLVALNGTLAKARKEHAAAADSWGSAHKKDEVIYTMAAGPNYGEAYAFAICLLQEMQWVNAAAIHAGEYFHGPFEITDADVPFIVLVGVGDTRPIDERAMKFVQKHSDRVLVIDAADFDFTGVNDDLTAYVQPIIFSKVLRGYADSLADHRGHPLTVRRYMWRMEY